MLKFFQKKAPSSIMNPTESFGYLKANDLYFDSACQTLRPTEVITAETAYYKQNNACGGRVKYKWGQQVDAQIQEARKNILKFLDKSEKDYTVVFTLNTTYGINLILQQLPAENFDQIIVSDIEHNSVFLPSMSWAKKNSKKRHVIARQINGSLKLEKDMLERSIVLVNTTSNIDGRELENAETLAKEIHAQSGIFLIDAAQTFSHHPEKLRSIDFDAAFCSAHKFYSPSLGFIIIKKSLIQKIVPFFIGGGTVTDVRENEYDLIKDEHEIYAPLELGLQNFAGIIGLKKALEWYQNFKPEGQNREEHQRKLGEKLYTGLKAIPEIQLVNHKASAIITFHTKKIDAHRLAYFLSEQGIMARSGYFCCHYYLKNKLQLPPLIRLSIGLHNTEEHIEKVITTISRILKNL